MNIHRINFIQMINQKHVLSKNLYNLRMRMEIFLQIIKYLSENIMIPLTRLELQMKKKVMIKILFAIQKIFNIVRIIMVETKINYRNQKFLKI